MTLTTINPTTARMTANVYGGKGYVARLAGTDPKYGAAREWLRKTDLSTGRTTYRDLEWIIPLAEGTVYEYSYSHSSGGQTRGYWHVRDGALVEIDRATALTLATA